MAAASTCRVMWSTLPAGQPRNRLKVHARRTRCHVGPRVAHGFASVTHLAVGQAASRAAGIVRVGDDAQHFTGAGMRVRRQGTREMAGFLDASF